MLLHLMSDVRNLRPTYGIGPPKQKFISGQWGRPARHRDPSRQLKAKLKVTIRKISCLRRLTNSVDIIGSKKKKKAYSKEEDQNDKHLNTLERLYSESPTHITDIQEVWFAVCSVPFSRNQYSS